VPGPGREPVPVLVKVEPPAPAARLRSSTEQRGERAMLAMTNKISDHAYSGVGFAIGTDRRPGSSGRPRSAGSRQNRRGSARIWLSRWPRPRLAMTITLPQAEDYARGYAARLKPGELIGDGQDPEQFYFDPDRPTLVTAAFGADDAEMVASGRADGADPRHSPRERCPQNDLAALEQALGEWLVRT
jgi:hypothetical protein